MNKGKKTRTLVPLCHRFAAKSRGAAPVTDKKTRIATRVNFPHVFLSSTSTLFSKLVVLRFDTHFSGDSSACFRDAAAGVYFPLSYQIAQALETLEFQRNSWTASPQTFRPVASLISFKLKKRIEERENKL